MNMMEHDSKEITFGFIGYDSAEAAKPDLWFKVYEEKGEGKQTELWASTNPKVTKRYHYRSLTVTEASV